MGRIAGIRGFRRAEVPEVALSCWAEEPRNFSVAVLVNLGRLFLAGICAALRPMGLGSMEEEHYRMITGSALLFLCEN